MNESIVRNVQGTILKKSGMPNEPDFKTSSEELKAQEVGTGFDKPIKQFWDVTGFV